MRSKNRVEGQEAGKAWPCLLIISNYSCTSRYFGEVEAPPSRAQLAWTCSFAGGGCASLLAHYGGSYPGTRGQTEGIHTGVIVQLLCAASKEGKVTALPAWLTKKLPLLALLRVYFTEWKYHPLL